MFVPTGETEYARGSKSCACKDPVAIKKMHNHQGKGNERIIKSEIS
jgi:hypothetical protein